MWPHDLENVGDSKLGLFALSDGHVGHDGPDYTCKTLSLTTSWRRVMTSCIFPPLGHYWSKSKLRCICCHYPLSCLLVGPAKLTRRDDPLIPTRISDMGVENSVNSGQIWVNLHDANSYSGWKWMQQIRMGQVHVQFGSIQITQYLF